MDLLCLLLQTCASTDDFDETSIGRMYDSQLAHLERLIASQKASGQRMKGALAAAERRHARVVSELESEKRKQAADAAQGDDVCVFLEKEREKLRQELEFEKLQVRFLKKKLFFY